MRSLGWALVYYGWSSEEEIRTQTRTEGQPCEDIGRRRPSAHQGERPQETPTVPTPGSWPSASRTVRINVHCLSYEICSTLLWQPQQTNIKRLLFFIKILSACLTYFFIFRFIASNCPKPRLCHTFLCVFKFSRMNTSSCLFNLREILTFFPLKRKIWNLISSDRPSTLICSHLYRNSTTEYYKKSIAFLVAQMVESAQETRAGDPGWIPESGRSPGGGHGNPLQYSHLGNPMDRGAWRATVHGVTKESDTTQQ